ncbi:uncharacterized protein LOC141881010 [Acropora palmata]|uniref:uncharacterized protein LOC141881010 n=1 Tax=Acropora palmata TaxID=6131 RepID=UPI003DA0DFC6
MKILLGCFAFLYLLSESCGDKVCTYKYFDSWKNKYVISTYRCLSNQYCCGNHSCCVYVYSRWYLWFIIVLVSFGAFLVWWYYRYRYRPRHCNVTPVHNNVVQMTRTGPAVITNCNMSVVNAPQPVYPMMTTTTGTSIQYSAFPQPSYPPPPYSNAMKR